MTEAQLVDWIRRQTGRPRRGSNLIVGIGDDCAVFRPRPGEDLVFKVDPMIEGVHFAPDLKPEIVGQRALGRALSDLAAMGADPRFCLVALSLPPDKTDAWARGFFKGLLKLARATGTELAGGDIASDSKVHCDVTVCGSVPKGQALLRSGARPGDELYVSGPLGKPWDTAIEPRLALGKKLRAHATSCIDISDGLALDLHRLCKESGVAAEVGEVPVFQGSTVERALHGGEDYELLFTLPLGDRMSKLATRIGRITKGPPGRVTFQGKRLPPAGWDHFHK